METISYQPFVIQKPPQQINPTSPEKDIDVNLNGKFCSIQELDQIASQIFAKENSEYLNDLQPIWPILKINSSGLHKSSSISTTEKKSNKRANEFDSDSSESKSPKLEVITISDTDDDVICTTTTANSLKSLIYVPPYKRNSTESNSAALSQRKTSFESKKKLSQSCRVIHYSGRLNFRNLKGIRSYFLGNNARINQDLKYFDLLVQSRKNHLTNLANYCQTYVEFCFSEKGLNLFPNFKKYLENCESSGCEVYDILKHDCFDDLLEELRCFFHTDISQSFIIFSVQRSKKLRLDQYGLRRSTTELDFSKQKKKRLEKFTFPGAEHNYKISGKTSKNLVSLRKKFPFAGKDLALQTHAGDFFLYVRQYFEFCLSEGCTKNEPEFLEYIVDKTEKNSRFQFLLLIQLPVFNDLLNEIRNFPKGEINLLFQHFLGYSKVFNVEETSVSSLSYLVKDLKPKNNNSKKKETKRKEEKKCGTNEKALVDTAKGSSNNRIVGIFESSNPYKVSGRTSKTKSVDLGRNEKSRMQTKETITIKTLQKIEVVSSTRKSNTRHNPDNEKRDSMNRHVNSVDVRIVQSSSHDVVRYKRPREKEYHDDVRFSDRLTNRSFQYGLSPPRYKNQLDRKMDYRQSPPRHVGRRYDDVHDLQNQHYHNYRAPTYRDHSDRNNNRHIPHPRHSSESCDRRRGAPYRNHEDQNTIDNRHDYSPDRFRKQFELMDDEYENRMDRDMWVYRHHHSPGAERFDRMNYDYNLERNRYFRGSINI